MRSITFGTKQEKGSVVIVDDLPANLSLLDSLLTEHGYETRSFPRGRLALAAAETEPPDLFLLDINMPEMNGYEVCERLKCNNRLSRIPVIFLSALTELEDKIKGFHAGGVDYIGKPFRTEEVLARVGAHVKLRQFQSLMEDDNSRLRQVVETQVKKIAEGHLATIFAIAKLADTRDGQTGLHLERIQTYCRMLANQALEGGLFGNTINTEWIATLSNASPLHDIGKVGIPDRILLKTGRLTREEFDVMKTHTTLGAETLRLVQARFADNALISMGIEIAQFHHERWDGSGYPLGLRAREIPLSARILAVADCYDAIRSVRYYKAAVSHAEAVQIILDNAGTQFDPQIAGVFADAAERFEAISKRMGDESSFGALFDQIAGQAGNSADETFALVKPGL